ncbi:unnamed protein product [Closterium sp. NIES-54]
MPERCPTLSFCVGVPEEMMIGSSDCAGACVGAGAFTVDCWRAASRFAVSVAISSPALPGPALPRPCPARSRPCPQPFPVAPPVFVAARPCPVVLPRPCRSAPDLSRPSPPHITSLPASYLPALC